MSVPFLAVGATYLELQDEIDAAYRRVMQSGWYILGQEVEAFEAEFAAYWAFRTASALAMGSRRCT